MAGYLSPSCKSSFGFYLHQWAWLFFVDFLDSTFVATTVLNSSLQTSFIEAPNHMISFSFFFLSKKKTFQMLSMDFFACFFFLIDIFGPHHELEDNLTWEKLNFSRTWVL